MRVLFFYKFGATLLLLFAVAHTAGHFASAGMAPSDAAEAELRRLQAEHRLTVAGVSRSGAELHAGLSLSLSGFCFLAAVLLLRIARHLRAAPALLAETAWIATAICAALAVLNAWLTVPPPAVLLGLATLAFAAAAWGLRRFRPGPA